MIPIYVISNGDLFQGAFNAVVTLIGDNIFLTIFNLSVAFSVLGVGFAYLQTQDLNTFFKWFAVYFIAANVLFGVKVDVEIIDMTNPGAVLTVDHVPFGLAEPASVITSLSHSLQEKLEMVFHMPDDRTYGKTGMLFGSRLFRLSTYFGIVDPQLKSDFNDYFRSCILGDVLINHQYSFNDLINSPNIWTTVSKGPSNIRGLYLNSNHNQFFTCKEATKILKDALDAHVKTDIISYFAQRIFGNQGDKDIKQLLMVNLTKAYDYYTDLSTQAQEIVTQDVLINAVRDGYLSYAAETGATGALLNLSSTRAMEQTRMAWGTSRNLSTYTLPLLQAVMLLILVGLFPIVIFLMIQPSVGVSVFRTYIYSLLWIESWPILFSIVNFAVSFYLHGSTASFAKAGITLSNANQVALEHSDLANTAGYLMAFIPLISAGLVRGMSSVFNTAANYVGGMVNSIASSAAGEAVTGNISLGNMSMNNWSANQHNFNATDMRGMYTYQLPNGAMVTQTASGGVIYNTQGAMSHLPLSINAGQALSESYSRSAESAATSALHSQESYHHALSNASAQLESFGHSSNYQKSVGQGFSVNKNTTFDQALSNMYSIANEVSQREQISFNDAFQRVKESSVSWNAGLDGKLGTSAVGAGYGASGGVGIGGRGSRSSMHTDHFDHTVNGGVTNRETQDFRDNLNFIQSYQANQHTDQSYSQSASTGNQISAELREADTYAKQYSADLSQSERLSQMATLASTHSASIQEDFAPGFVDYVRHVDRMRAEKILSNTNEPNMVLLREQYAQAYLSRCAKQFELSYENKKSGIQPQAFYQSGIQTIASSEKPIIKQYHQNSADLEKQERKLQAPIDQAQRIENTVRENQSAYQQSIEKGGKNELENYQKTTQAKNEAITQGKEKAQIGVAHSIWNSTEESAKEKFKKDLSDLRRLK